MAYSSKSLESYGEKYNFTVNIGMKSIIFTRPNTKEFEEIELSCQDSDWSLSVMREIETRSNPDYVFKQTE